MARTGRPPLPPSRIRTEGDIAYVELTQGKEAIIDVEDIPLVADRRWSAGLNRGVWYVYSTSGRKLMHRVIMGEDDPKVMVDHRDLNPLHNRKANLRKSTGAQNQMNKGLAKNNTSGYKGVWLDKRSNRWISYIEFNGKRFHVCSGVATAEEAARMYDDAARRFHGEFARMNFPREGELGVR